MPSSVIELDLNGEQTEQAYYEYFAALAKLSKRPIFIQTTITGQPHALGPSVELMVKLATEFPHLGHIKEETPPLVTRMKAEADSMSRDLAKISELKTTIAQERDGLAASAESLRLPSNTEDPPATWTSSCPAAGGERLRYSHSMVPGGLLVMSSVTRFTSRTSLVIRVEIFASTS